MKAVQGLQCSSALCSGGMHVFVSLQTHFSPSIHQQLPIRCFTLQYIYILFLLLSLTFFILIICILILNLNFAIFIFNLIVHWKSQEASRLRSNENIGDNLSSHQSSSLFLLLSKAQKHKRRAKYYIEIFSKWQGINPKLWIYLRNMLIVWVAVKCQGKVRADNFRGDEKYRRPWKASSQPAVRGSRWDRIISLC